MSFAAGSQTYTAIDDATGTEKLWSSRTDSAAVDTGRSLYLFARNNDGAPDGFCMGRLYFLKLWQNGTLVRDFKPVRLWNGLVVLWDFVNNEPYLPQSKTAPYNYTTFPVVGPDGDRIYTSTRIVVR